VKKFAPSILPANTMGEQKRREKIHILENRCALVKKRRTTGSNRWGRKAGQGKKRCLFAGGRYVETWPAYLLLWKKIKREPYCPKDGSLAEEDA